jgi:hypothetical protein
MKYGVLSSRHASTPDIVPACTVARIDQAVALIDKQRPG